jgi:hypothetical protein
MSYKLKWHINSRRSICEYCQSNDFTDTGFCENCGAPLLFNGNEDWNPNKESVTMPVAANRSIKKEECYICGELAKDKLNNNSGKALDIMVKLMIAESPEMKEIEEFGAFLFNKVAPTKSILVDISRAIKSDINIALPTAINEFYYTESNYYALEDASICLKCAWKEFKAKLVTVEPETPVESLVDRVTRSMKDLVATETKSSDTRNKPIPETSFHDIDQAEDDGWEDDEWEDSVEEWPEERAQQAEQQSQHKYYIDENGSIRKK